jgi:hypothetical protein
MQRVSDPCPEARNATEATRKRDVPGVFVTDPPEEMLMGRKPAI